MIEELNKEAGDIQSFLEVECSDNPLEIRERLYTLSVYLAAFLFAKKAVCTGKMLSDAKRLLREKKSSQIAETVIKIAKENYLSAKAQNAIIDSLAVEENTLVDWVDRLNSACVHQSDICRTLLSYIKQEMAASLYNNQ